MELKNYKLTRIVSVNNEGKRTHVYDIEVGSRDHAFVAKSKTGAVGISHNSAQVAIGDCDDVEYLLAKRWDMGTIPSWRAMSNNSVVCEDPKDLHEYFWDGYIGKGEPYGLINLRLSKKIGRIGETQYPDPTVQGYNPCCEQGLAPFETCCLAEVFLPNISSKDELFDVVTLLYRINKHSLALDCHLPETQDIVRKNMRMGIGMTGVLQASEEQISWLSDAYEHLRKFDEEYSATHGFNPSIKLTTIKPSGCTSLETGVKTSNGIKTMEEIFNGMGYATDFLKNAGDRVWLDISGDPVTVYDENNEEQTVTKLYVNGVEPVWEIEMEDGQVYKFTGNHKLKTNNGWKRVDELTDADEIISFKE